MKKPITVRAAGWSCVGCSLAFVLLALGLGPGRSGAREYAPIFAGLEMAMGVSALWWIVGTLLHRGRTLRARAVAEALSAELAKRKPEPQAVRPASAGFEASPILKRFTCVLCSSVGAVLRCATHNLVLCQGCLVRHDQPGVCNYTSAWTAPPAARRG